MEDNSFLKIIRREIPAYIVDENDIALAFLDINPATLRHTLVTPKRVARDIFGISDEDIAAVACMARQIALRIDRLFKPNGINLVSSSRAAAGQEVFHFHLHVIPRYENDSVHFS
jgi:histidine triad (HIT) family protein